MGADARFSADERVGDYRICGLLGEGAMGEVYLAQDMVLGRRVALKVLKREVMATDGVARFLEEARVTASFNHPHIVTLHAFGEHAGRPYPDGSAQVMWVWTEGPQWAPYIIQCVGLIEPYLTFRFQYKDRKYGNTHTST